MMPNSIGTTGLTTATQAELVATLTAAFQTIYGADINLSSDTPDGQLLNIFVQVVLDVLDLNTQIYNMFDPDLAIGAVLDQRVAINGIQRQAGTFTITNISIVTAQAVTLFGLEQTDQPVYTVQDNAGNMWKLQTTQHISGSGTTVAAFQAATPGANLTVPNTITIPVTIVLGVTSVNNPTTYSSLGINEESDAALRLRRQISVSLPSQGYLAGLLAALENVNGITSAFVYENETGTTNGDGVPGHSIWVIVSGSGASVDIATAIYTKRNAGCGMFGSLSYTITQVDGSPFIVYWDVVSPVPLFINFTATSLDGINPPNIAAIRAGLATSFVPGVFQEVNINALATAVQVLDSNTLVTAAGFGLTSTGPFTNTLTPATKNNQFAVTSANIIITPMVMTPSSATVARLASQTFTGLGGYGAITYTMHTNVSGGSVNSSTGVYTAGSSTGTDVVRATDTLSNFVDANVTVT